MDNRERYNRYKALHPEWSDDQIWAAISIEMEAEKVLEKEGPDMQPNDPDVIREILNGARNWLQEVLPAVFERVAQFFEKLISTIGVWVQKGLSYVLDGIAWLLNKD